MYPRNITPRLLAALKDSPIVMLHGARQCGKTTLVKRIAERDHPAKYLTFDHAGLLAAAREDPAGFLAGLESPVILDEVQRVPDLFLALKAEIDRDRRAGRFLLTGSAHALLLPRLSEALVGRMEIIPLRPLSQGEHGSVVDGFVDAIFNERSPGSLGGASEDLEGRVLAGGYPEAIRRRETERRRAWLDSYLTMILQRDVRDLAAVERLAEFPRLLALLASRSGGLLNFASLAGDAGIPASTLKRYFALLEATFLIETLPPWHVNLGKRLVKSPKVHISDSGLMAHLLGATGERLENDRTLFGALLESFVVGELRRQIDWSRTAPMIYHFRTHSGQEVDVVLEDRKGSVVGLEVIASKTVSPGDFSGLRMMAEALGERFHRGVVLHTGSETIPFGKNLFAMPVASLWETAQDSSG